MNFNRVRQFCWELISKIDERDINFINDNLTNEEKVIFVQLSKAEQTHSIRVAKDLIKCSKEYKNVNCDRLIKAGLLHDIGKINCNLSIIDKSVIVILDKITNGKIKAFSKFKKIDTYYNHGNIGYSILKAQVKDEILLNLIANHHRVDLEQDEEMKLLKLCDDRN